MKLYLDTSLLVAAFTPEIKTAVVLDWLRVQQVETLVISPWVIAEFSSALSVKLRTGQLDGAQRADALARFGKLCADSLTILPVAEGHFAAAARFADHHALGLRAADALHLGICQDIGATLHTLDKRLAAAGSSLGIQTKLV